MYIFDTSAFIVLKHYYRQSFPSLWTGIEELIEGGAACINPRGIQRTPKL